MSAIKTVAISRRNRIASLNDILSELRPRFSRDMYELRPWVFQRLRIMFGDKLVDSLDYRYIFCKYHITMYC
jgi:hypothetical protein